MNSASNKNNSNSTVTEPSQQQKLFLRKLLQEKKYNETIIAAQKLLEKFPSNPELYCTAGEAAVALGKLDLGLKFFSVASKIDSQSAEIKYNIGSIYQQLGTLDKAVECWEQVIEISPNFYDAHRNLGLAYSVSGKTDLAIARFESAIQVSPRSAQAHYNLGLAYRESGRKELAISQCRKAIGFEPSYAEAHRTLAFLKKFTGFDEDIVNMQDAYAQSETSDMQKMHLAFGLGKSMEDLGEFGDAFQFYLSANQLNRKSFHYSIDAEIDAMGSVKSFFNGDFFAKHTDAGHNDKSPIFIVGMPRSGTTLVEQILSSHQDVFGAGELEFLTNSVEGISNEKKGKLLQNATAAEVADAGRNYVDLIRALNSDTKYITDKMPLNFLKIGLIKLILPKAKVIHCRRDAKDTCLSIFKNYFAPGGNFFAYDLVELGKFYNLYEDMMEHWHAVLHGFIYDIQYEELVADQESNIRSLLEFCNLPWDSACMDFHKSTRVVKTASATQVRNPMYSDSVSLWKRYEAELSPLIEVLESK